MRLKTIGKSSDPCKDEKHSSKSIGSKLLICNDVFHSSRGQIGPNLGQSYSGTMFFIVPERTKVGACRWKNVFHTKLASNFTLTT
jgi:hypothetical protein